MAEPRQDEEFLTPEDRLYLAGLEPQGEFTPEQFQGGNFSERLAGLQGFQHPAPTSFGEGLLYGAVGGLGAAGSRVAAARAKFDESERQRHAAFDKDRLEASRAMRTERGRLLRDREKEKSDTRKEREKYERDYVIPTPDQLKAAPWIARLPKDKEGRVKASDIASAMEPNKAEKSLKQIEDEAAARARGTASGGGVPAYDEIDEPTRQSMVRAFLAGVPLNQVVPGFGKQAVGLRLGVWRDAAKFNPDLATALGSYKADQKSYSEIQQIVDANEAFSRTADANTKVLEAAFAKVPNLGARFLNKPVRQIADQLGSEATAAVKVARQTVQNEYGRLLSSAKATGVAALPEGQRKEVEAALAEDYTPGQIKAALDILRQDATNKRQSYQAQLNEIQGRIRAREEGNPSPMGGAQSRLPTPGGLPVGPAPSYQPGGWFDQNKPGVR